ncbi:MAG TPA: hypothetical protein VMJ35_06720 [Dongiaceae bacterium]|nr:hypothetical protein [Dongiaceae bacterium]
MRRNISVLAVVCFLSCVPVFAQKTTETPKAADYEDADGYAVLSILLSRAHSEVDPSFLLAPFLISPLTVSGMNPDSFQACSRVPTEFASAATDFRDKNKQTWNLTKRINLKFSYKFTSTGKHTPLAPTQNAKDVPPALFETSVYQVSAVGFDASRTHAIVYVGAVCGPDCASGSYHLLVKEKEGWKETSGSPVCHWMSFNTDFLSDRRPS